MLVTNIKASNIINLTDARYFAAVGAEWLGFNFNPKSPKNVSLELGKEIIEWVVGPKNIGEFDHQPLEVINEVVEILGLNHIQTDIDLDFTKLHPRIETVTHRIKISHLDTYDDLIEKMEELGGVTQFLLDFTENNLTWDDVLNGGILTNEDLKQLCSKFNVLLQIPLTTKNLSEILNKIEPFGLSVLGANEEVVGEQVYDEMNDLMEMLEEDF